MKNNPTPSASALERAEAYATFKTSKGKLFVDTDIKDAWLAGLAEGLSVAEEMAEALDKIWDTPCAVNSVAYQMAAIAERALANFRARKEGTNEK